VSAGQAAAGRRLARTLRRRRGRTKGARALLPVLPPRVKRWLLVALAICLVLAMGYRFWFRESSFVTVEQVKVTGLTTKDAPRVRAALASAAHTMTTLHVRHDVLQQAIAAYPVVRALDVRTDFPHGLTIRVIEHRAAALAGGVPIAGDGTILRGLPVEGSLPKLDARGVPHGNRLTEPAALHAARVAGAAPAALLPRLELIEVRAQDGIVVQMRDGPELIFGDATHVRAKWIAATRVLADPEAEGASYIDVRLPGRPAAGGLPAATLAPVAPAGTADQTTPPATGAPTAGTTVDPATEQLPSEAPATTTPATDPSTSQPTTQTNTEQAAPPSSGTPVVPTDSTGAGGASAPPG
jgi:cell division protein FtsQ